MGLREGMEGRGQPLSAAVNTATSAGGGRQIDVQIVHIVSSAQPGSHLQKDEELIVSSRYFAPPKKMVNACNIILSLSLSLTHPLPQCVLHHFSLTPVLFQIANLHSYISLQCTWGALVSTWIVLSQIILLFFLCFYLFFYYFNSELQTER